MQLVLKKATTRNTTYSVRIHRKKQDRTLCTGAKEAIRQFTIDDQKFDLIKHVLVEHEMYKPALELKSCGWLISRIQHQTCHVGRPGTTHPTAVRPVSSQSRLSHLAVL